ncbi:hypothetical protein Rt10032_c18g6089 [Rhodotorula toruloides]|uniref:Uncharacterized protein n=1 Tax=Rhodotorula toruloides TaxID=5286 RepID=A0A511KNX2_RHOTO|nr:hypothetical protein Rt10032_c18g6089 [Rhodotorula toruloides]
MVSHFTTLLDAHLPESVRAGPEISSGCGYRDRGDLDRDGDVINLETKPAFVIWRNHVPSVVVLVQHPRASSEPHGVLNRLIEAFRSSPVQRIDAELKKRDSHLYFLLLRIVVSCRSRSCNAFLLFDYLQYLVSFLVPFDPSFSDPGFQLVFSALSRSESRETPLAQLATALLHADKFFDEELRRRMDGIVQSRARLSPLWGGHRIGRSMRTRRKIRIQRFRIVYPDGRPAEFTPCCRFHPLGASISYAASEAAEEAVTALEIDDYLGHGATSHVFRAYFPSSSLKVRRASSRSETACFFTMAGFDFVLR